MAGPREKLRIIWPTEIANEREGNCPIDRGEVPKLQITSRLKEILSIFLPGCYIGKATIAHRAETLRSIDLPASLRARRKGDREEEEGSLAKSQKELRLFVTP